MTTRRHILIYVAGPISRGDLMENVRKAHEAGVALLKAGFSVIVPHGSCFWGNATGTCSVAGVPWPPTAFVPEVLPSGTTHDDWYKMDLEIVSRCDGVLRLEGESVGADLEVEQARRLGLPVFSCVEDVITWASGEGRL